MESLESSAKKSLKKSVKSIKNNTWFILNSKPESGLFNMACDNYLLGLALPNPILRIYSWNEMTLSLGSNMSQAGNKSEMPVVKRITGGQAVTHYCQKSELTYSLVINYGPKVKELYLTVGKVLISLLEKYGLNADFGYDTKNYMQSYDCFESKTPGDIVVNNEKIIGSAQARKQNYILQHGSIRLDLIRKFTGGNVSYEEVSEALTTSFEENLNITFVPYELTNTDINKISKDHVDLSKSV